MSKAEFLQQYIFVGLKDINTGFDASSISYFTQKEFEEVLKRIELVGGGIHGIEPFLNGEFWDVKTCPHGEENTPSKWYKRCFYDFRARAKLLKLELQYSATYYVPEELLAEK